MHPKTSSSERNYTLHRHLLILLFIALLGDIAWSDLHSIHIEKGRRRTSSGDTISYHLYIPLRSESLPAPPWPAVILYHGFGRDRRYQAKNAEYMARRGIVVLTPDMASLIAGEPAELRNIENSLDHIEWLTRRNAADDDSLKGLIDPSRIGLAGHSAGAAVSFEAAVEAQKRGISVAAICLLDGVPWRRTVKAASALTQLPLVSLRSDRSLCTTPGDVSALLKSLPFPGVDIHLNGAGHCDAENPTNWLCTLVCGRRSHPDQQTLYQRLLYLFFYDSLRAGSVDPNGETFESVIDRLAAEKRVTRTIFAPRGTESTGPAEE